MCMCLQSTINWTLLNFELWGLRKNIIYIFLLDKKQNETENKIKSMGDLPF